MTYRTSVTRLLPFISGVLLVANPAVVNAASIGKGSTTAGTSAAGTGAAGGLNAGGGSTSAVSGSVGGGGAGNRSDIGGSFYGVLDKSIDSELGDSAAQEEMSNKAAERPAEFSRACSASLCGQSKIDVDVDSGLKPLEIRVGLHRAKHPHVAVASKASPAAPTDGPRHVFFNNPANYVSD
jgi:hypothetical protein